MLQAMRAQKPLVHCITNFVAMNIAANVLLAAGASPAMVHAEEEAGEFAAISGALTINIGTLSSDWMRGMRAATIAANEAGRPWVLDPVAHYATRFRREAVQELLALRPTIIRGNASEIIALAGGVSQGQGVDSRDPVEQAEASAACWQELTGRWSLSPVSSTLSPTVSAPAASKVVRRGCLM
jgi:hydroxyethylthiazole kinase